MDPDSYLSVFSSAIEITAPSGGAILAIVLAGLFLCVSAFVSASEIAYFSLTSEELQEFDEESPRDRLVKRLLAHPEHLLATIRLFTIWVERTKKLASGENIFPNKDNPLQLFLAQTTGFRFA